MIEKHGEEVILKPVLAPKFRSFTEIARYLEEKFPDAGEFPDLPPRPKRHERSILEF